MTEFSFEEFERQFANSESGSGADPLAELEYAAGLTWRFYKVLFETTDRLCAERGIEPITTDCSIVKMVASVAEAHELSGDDGADVMADEVGLGPVGLVLAISSLGPHTAESHPAQVAIIREVIELPHVKSLTDQIEAAERHLSDVFGGGAE